MPDLLRVISDHLCVEIFYIYYRQKRDVTIPDHKRGKRQLVNRNVTVPSVNSGVLDGCPY